jgi:hypothetical protein
MRLAIVAVGLAGCWTGSSPGLVTPSQHASSEDSAKPAAPDDYLAQTIVADATGVALMTIGFVGLHHDFNSDVYGGLVVAGVATSTFASPVIHLAHGRKGRAGGSYLVRSIGATFGTFAGMATACSNGLAVLGECGVGRIFMGGAAGLALGGVVDALFFHDDESPRHWAPIVAPTPGGTNVGFATAF